jgi:hypothetical protein
VPKPIAPCRCVERAVTIREELVLKDGKFVRVKMQFECCECGRYAVVKILDGEEKP